MIFRQIKIQGVQGKLSCGTCLVQILMIIMC